MAILQPDVSFPLRGGSTAAVTDRLRLRLLHLGGTTIDARWGHADFTAPYWRIYLNFDDGVEVRVPRGTFQPLKAGHLYLLPAWLAWSGRCQGAVRHLNASLELPNLPRERVAAVCTQVLHLANASSPLAAAWLRLGAELTQTTHPSALQVARGYALAYDALAAGLAQLGPAADGLVAAPGEALLADVVAWIERNLATPLPVAAVSRAAGCSRAELVRRFQAAYGTSPARWVRQRRVTVAADLLRCTNDPIEAIAAQVGFTDRSRFSKAFTALIGLAPARWRRRERG
jgi:AraC-like DNA-binding protein